MELRTYDSFEAMQADMQAAEDAANAALLPAQERLRDRHDRPAFWFRPTEYGFEIYGQAWSHHECLMSSLKHGCTPHEAEEEQASVVEARRRGYLFGKAFSPAEPDGELGSTHVADVIPISEAAFNLARVAHWNSENDHDLLLMLRDAVTHSMAEPRTA